MVRLSPLRSLLRRCLLLAFLLTAVLTPPPQKAAAAIAPGAPAPVAAPTAAPAPVPVAGATDPVRVILDGRELALDPAATIRDGRTLVPLRGVFEAMGAQVDWHPEDHSVTAVRGDRFVRLVIGRRLACAGDPCREPTLLDVPALETGGRTFVPLRFIATALGAGVSWDAAANAVRISNAGPPLLPPPGMELAAPLAGQTIGGPVSIRARATDPRAATLRVFLLDPVTGQGPLLAVVPAPDLHYTWEPDAALGGERVLAVVAYDAGDQFLDGAAVAVAVAPDTRIRLTGVEPGTTVSEPFSFGVANDFVITHIQYAWQRNGGDERQIAAAGPGAAFTWYPQVSDNGPGALLATAFDRAGNAYPAPPVPLTLAVPHRTFLQGIQAGAVLDGPVNLRIATNYPLTRWMILLIDPQTKLEWVLAEGQGTPETFRWFPGADRNGTWQLAAATWDTDGTLRRTDPVAFSVATQPTFRLRGVGPGAIVHGTVTLSGEANYPFTRVQYILRDPARGTRTVVAGGSDVEAAYDWTPTAADAGPRELLAALTRPDGSVFETEAVPIRVYVGPIYGKQPVMPKERFLDFVGPLARQSYWQTGMAASLQAAQAILETGWGQSSPVDKYTGQVSYNLFGIKGTGPAGSVVATTWEEYNGVAYVVDDHFRAYAEPAQSWQDHKAFLLQMPRYAPFRAVMSDPVLGAWALQRAGYATDSQYPGKLINIMQREGLFALDVTEP